MRYILLGELLSSSLFAVFPQFPAFLCDRYNIFMTVHTFDRNSKQRCNDTPQQSDLSSVEKNFRYIARAVLARNFILVIATKQVTRRHPAHPAQGLMPLRVYSAPFVSYLRRSSSSAGRMTR